MNKLAIITGANSGLGFETAKALLENSFDLVLIVRSQDKSDSTKNELLRLYPKGKIDFEITDLSDLNSVKKVAENIKRKYTSIDRLINNAGYSADTIEFIEAGYEKSFVANHLGHFLLTNILLDSLKASKDGRIINVSSAAHGLGKFSRMFLKNNTNLSLFQSYADGKLANVFFTKGLKKRIEGSNVLTFSLHPGVVSTNFGSNYSGFFKFMISAMKPFMISPETGAQTSIFLAITKRENIKKYNGEYFAKSKVKSTNHTDLTANNIEAFWKMSEEAIV